MAKSKWFSPLILVLMLPSLASAIDNTPSAISNTGINPGIDSNGSIIAIAHQASSNAILLTFSLDNGSTWADRATGHTPSPSAIVDLDVIVINATSYLIVYCCGDDAGRTNFRWLYTEDSGFTWSTSFFSRLNACNTWVGHKFDLDFDGTTIMVLGAANLNSGTCGGGAQSNIQGYVWNVTSGGPTWTTTLLVNNAAGTYSGVGLDLTSWGNFTAYTVGPVSEGRSWTDNTAGSAFPLQDFALPVAGYPEGFAVDHDNGGIFYSKNATSSEWLAGTRIGATTAHVFDGPAFNTSNDLDGAFYTGTRYGFAADIDGSVYLVTSCDLGATWATNAIATDASTTARPTTTNEGNTVWIVYQTFGNSSMKIVQNNDTTCVSSGAQSSIHIGASASIPGLVAFDVDPTGASVLIAKRDNGTNVSTYAPQTLSQYASANMGCQGFQFSQGIGGIDATAYSSSGVVAYTVCGSVGGGGTGDVDEIRLRNSNLGALDLSGCSYCRSGISEADDAAFSNNINLPDNIVGLDYIEQFPYTFSAIGYDGGAIYEGTIIAFPFTELATGQFGIYAVEFKNNAIDTDTTTRVAFSSAGTTVNDICSWRSSATGLDYIAVSESATGLKVYSFNINAGGNGDLDPGEVTIQQRPATPSAFQQATSISCAGNMILATLTGNRVGAFYVDADDQGHVAGQIAWGPITLTAPGIAILHNAATLSPSGLFAAYNDGTIIKIVNATTGSVVGSVTRTAGDLYGMKIDRPNNSLWTATGYPVGTLTRYSLINATNNGVEVIDTNPSPSGTNPTGTAPPTPPSAPAGGATGAALEVLTGIEGSGDIMLAILYILMFAAGAYGIFGGNVIGIGIGAICGFAFSVFSGLIPEIIVFLMVILAVAAVAFRIFGGSSQSEGM